MRARRTRGGPGAEAAASVAQVSGPMRPCCRREPGGDRWGGDRNPESTEKLMGQGSRCSGPCGLAAVRPEGRAGSPESRPRTLRAEGL